MKEKFYEMSIGRATRYLTITQKKKSIQSNEEFYEEIKKKRITFTEDRGKMPGDLAIGSWVTLFFSEKFIRLLKEYKIKSLRAYKIPFESKHDNKTNYYYIEPNSSVDCIVDGSYLEKENREELQSILDKWMKTKKNVYLKGHDIMKTFYNFSTWSGSDLFGAKNTNVIIVTEKLKNIIEKAKLKNVQFEELKQFEYEK